jgi:hypothetical protein
MENDQITITKTKVKTIHPKNNPNKKEEEKTESVSKIYIQEGQKKVLVYKEKEEIPHGGGDSTVLRDDNTKKYNKVNANKNNNSRYSNSLDRNAINKNAKRKENTNKETHLKRKSVDRGGNYKNIKVTHIINSTLDIDFHIIDPLDVSTDESRKKLKVNINKNNRNGKNGKVKVAYMSSCDDIKIPPKEKKKNIGKIQVISHRENPNLKKTNKNKNNNAGTSSVMSKQRYSKQVNKNERK